MRHAVVVLLALGLTGAYAGAETMDVSPTQVMLSDSGAPQARGIQGKVQALNWWKKTVTLEDGTTLAIPKAVKATPTALKEGAMVTASYEVQDGQKVIIALDVWPPSEF